MNIRLSAVLVAPLLLACGSDNSGGGGTTYVMPPTCSGSGQVLSTDTTGQLVCKALPAGTASLPSCDLNTQALTSDGNKPLCDNLNTVDSSTQTQLDMLTTIEKTLVDYGTQLNVLGSAPGKQQATFVGLTPDMVSGRITSGSLVGIPAATALCVKKFGSGSHMCSVYEIYLTAGLQKDTLLPGSDVLGGWAYMQSWRAGTKTSTEYGAGLADNCAGYTYETSGDPNKWTGTKFAWVNSNAGVRVTKFTGNTPCSTVQPIACCQ